MNRTKIEWCDYTWNPIVGCTMGCAWCYARRQAKRMKHRCEQCYLFEPHLHPERLEEPGRVKRPSRIFVCSMGELFDAMVFRSTLDQVLDAMDRAPWHTYIILTKRPDYMAAALLHDTYRVAPRPNWWLLTSITNQADAKKRVPEMMTLRAAGWTTGVSIEPMLGPVDLHDWIAPWRKCDSVTLRCIFEGLINEEQADSLRAAAALSWVILGAMTGPRAKAVNHEHVAALVDQCFEAQVPCFVKDNVGGILSKVRGYPRIR